MQLETMPYARCPRAIRAQVRALYKEAFPEVERIELWKLRAMALRRDTRFDVYLDGGALCGFTFSSALGNAVYLLFLAVNGSARSQGYGSAILAALKHNRGGRRTIIDIEPIGEGAQNEEQRVRRLAFYRRNGFHETGLQTIDRGERYDILTDEDGFDPAELAAVVRRMSFGLYKMDITRRME